MFSLFCFVSIFISFSLPISGQTEFARIRSESMHLIKRRLESGWYLMVPLTRYGSRIWTLCLMITERYIHSFWVCPFNYGGACITVEVFFRSSENEHFISENDNDYRSVDGCYSFSGVFLLFDKSFLNLTNFFHYTFIHSGSVNYTSSYNKVKDKSFLHSYVWWVEKLYSCLKWWAWSSNVTTFHKLL